MSSKKKLKNYKKLINNNNNKIIIAKGIWKKSIKIDPSKCFIKKLPEELLIRIFSYLDPDSLTLVSWVCSSWNKAIKNETIWKEAFIDSFENIPYEKVTTGGWREEYTTRVNLIDLWKRKKPNVIEYRCMYSNPDIFYANFEKSLLYVGWLNQGLISISNPSTGRNERHNIGLMGDFMPQPVSCVKMDKDNIIVGEFNGKMARISNFKEKILNIKYKRFQQLHHSQITCIEWIPTYSRVIAVGTIDGQVSLWDTKNKEQLAKLSNIFYSSITTIIIDPKRYIIAGNSDGQIQIWEINIFDLLKKKNTEIDINGVPIFSKIEMKNPILSLHYDPISETMIIACKKGSSNEQLTHWNISTGKKLNIFRNGHINNELTAVAWTKERQGNSSNVQRTRLTGINSVINNEELHGLEDSLVCSSDASGRVCFWNFEKCQGSDASSISSGENINSNINNKNNNNSSQINETFEKSTIDGSNLINPSKVYDIHEGPVNAILIDSFKVITAGSDCVINVFDSLCNNHIRKFIGRKPKNGINKINGIDMDKYKVCINYGNSIKVWNFEIEKDLKKNQKKSKELLSTNVLKHSIIKHDLKEYSQMMEMEKKIEKKKEKINIKNSKRFNGSINEYLTEEEMLNYAMMISMEEKEKEKEKEKEQNFLIESGVVQNNINEDEDYYRNEYEYENENQYDYENDNWNNSSESLRDMQNNNEISMEYEDINNIINKSNINEKSYGKGKNIENIERNNKNNNNKEKKYFNTTDMSNEEFVEQSVNDFLNDISDKQEKTISSTSFFINENNIKGKNSLTEYGNNKNELVNNKNKKETTKIPNDSSKSNKNKKKKNKKSKYIPLDEWEEATHGQSYENSSSFDTMNEEEYLEYVLQLSLHDK